MLVKRWGCCLNKARASQLPKKQPFLRRMLLQIGQFFSKTPNKRDMQGYNSSFTSAVATMVSVVMMDGLFLNLST